MCGKHSVFKLFFFFSPSSSDIHGLHVRHCYQLTAATRMIPPSSPQEYLKCDYERAKITMSALVIKMSSGGDNMSCNVKTLLTEHATFLQSCLIRYRERHLMSDVMSAATLLCLNRRQLLICHSAFFNRGGERRKIYINQKVFCIHFQLSNN